MYQFFYGEYLSTIGYMGEHLWVVYRIHTTLVYDTMVLQFQGKPLQKIHRNYNYHEKIIIPIEFNSWNNHTPL